MKGLVSLGLAIFVATALPAGSEEDRRGVVDQRREKQRLRILDDRGRAFGVDAGTQRLAATPCVGGLAGTYPCANVDLLSFTPGAAIGGGDGNDLWGWFDSVSGREYALVGREAGTSFVDVSDPENPVYVGWLQGRGSPSVWRDIKVHADHAYIVSESLGHGLQVFDLTDLRDVTVMPAQLSEAGYYDGFGSAHNVAINEDSGFAYAVGTGTCAGGPHMVDLAVPDSPIFAGCHVESIYTHDAHCVNYVGPDSDYAGREICINSNESRINAIDVTTKPETTLISQTVYAGWAYTHQGWLTEDQRYYLQGDELDEQQAGHPTRTRVFDMRDLDAPLLIGTYDGTTAAIDHNIYTLNDYAYLANYRAGLQILDLADVASGTLTEVGSFDIYPSSDSAQFNGAWSVYPYLPSGNVLVNGIEQGLFVVRPSLPPDYLLGIDTDRLSVCNPDVRQVDIEVRTRNGYGGQVSLATAGLPAGATPLFSTDTVAPPGSSSLTIGVDGVAPGNYPFTVDGTDGTLTRQLALELQVATTVPPGALLVAPADAAVDVPRLPLLDWAPAPQAVSYTVEVALDPEFSAVVRTEETNGSSVALSDPLVPSTTHYWRVTARNACGVGEDSAVGSFTTVAIARILLVDDDDNSPNVRDDYVDALVALGESHDLWDTDDTDDEPTLGTLAPYEVVIWFTGDSFGGTAGPGAGGESALSGWLDTSGCLLIAAQDYFYDRGLTPFMQGYLGLDSAQSDVGYTTITGRGGLFSGLGPFTLDFPYSNWVDDLVPGANGRIAFDETGGGGVAIDQPGDLFRTAYWSFGLETLPTVDDRQAVLARFLSTCTDLQTADGDLDATPNDEDCAAGDATVWRAPSPARALTLGTVSRDDLSWSPPDVPGATTLTFDVLRSSDPTDFTGGACVESGDFDLLAEDLTTPAPRELFSYLVRVSNPCGRSLGRDSDDGERASVDCGN